MPLVYVSFHPHWLCQPPHAASMTGFHDGQGQGNVVVRQRCKAYPVVAWRLARCGSTLHTLGMNRHRGCAWQAEQYKRQLARLEQREEERFGTSEGLGVDIDDVSCQPDEHAGSIIFRVCH
jgi:hypothetical protein